MKPETVPAVSVLMPTYDQGAFIQRAIESLFAQSLSDWELVVVDDHSPDDTADLVARYAEIDTRIRLLCLERNRGLGAALNAGLEQAQAEIIAYLPSDDVYFRDHLANLVALLNDQPETTLAYAGVRYRRTEEAVGRIPGESLQLVQVAHRRTPERWVERGELVTDDLERMYWGTLQSRGLFAGTGMVSCEWVDHPAQRHRAIRLRGGLIAASQEGFWRSPQSSSVCERAEGSVSVRIPTQVRGCSVMRATVSAGSDIEKVDCRASAFCSLAATIVT